MQFLSFGTSVTHLFHCFLSWILVVKHNVHVDILDYQNIALAYQCWLAEPTFHRPI